MFRIVARDPGFIILMAGVFLFCVVSSPATFRAVEPFHHNSRIFTLAYFAALEFGAIACKLLTVSLPEFKGRLSLMTFFLLAVTTVSNYITGMDLFMSADLGPTFGSIKDSGYEVAAVIIYAGTIPTLLYIFLSMAAKRAEHLTKQYRVSATMRAVEPIRDAVDTFVNIQAALRGLTSLPSQSFPQLRQPLGASSDSPSEPNASERLVDRRRISTVNRRHKRRAAERFSAATSAKSKILTLFTRSPVATPESEGLSNQDMTDLFGSWSGFCPQCGNPAEPTVDHIIPISRGGAHTKDNVRLVCSACNLEKGARIDSDPPSLTDQIKTILDECPEGITFPDLRKRLGRDSTGDQHLRTTLKKLHSKGQILALRQEGTNQISFVGTPSTLISNGTGN